MPNRKLHLLLVDDDIPLRFLLEKIVQQLGYEVWVAEDGLSALRCLSERSFDILLSDLHMPRMSGLELLSVVRRRYPSTHVIAMSGSFPGANVPDGVAADAYYEKGSHPDTLLALLLEGATLLPATGRVPDHAEPVVWIGGEVRDSSSGRSIAISCPECLRPFQESMELSSPRIHGTICPHCRSRVRYALVDELQAFQLATSKKSMPSVRLQ